jgi:hypothetical protein
VKHTSTESQERFYSLAGTILEVILQWITSPTVARIGKRLDLMSSSVTLPDEGYGDVRAIAAHLNISEAGAFKLVNRVKNLRSFKPGQSILFRYEDIAKLAKSETIGGAR